MLCYKKNQKDDWTENVLFSVYKDYYQMYVVSILVRNKNSYFGFSRSLHNLKIFHNYRVS